MTPLTCGYLFQHSLIDRFLVKNAASFSILGWVGYGSPGPQGMIDIHVGRTGWGKELGFVYYLIVIMPTNMITVSFLII